VRIQSDTHVQIKKAFEVVRCITALYWIDSSFDSNIKL
jgi:hypothetical protein